MRRIVFEDEKMQGHLRSFHQLIELRIHRIKREFLHKQQQDILFSGPVIPEISQEHVYTRALCF